MCSDAAGPLSSSSDNLFDFGPTMETLDLTLLLFPLVLALLAAILDLSVTTTPILPFGHVTSLWIRSISNCYTRAQESCYSNETFPWICFKEKQLSPTSRWCSILKRLLNLIIHMYCIVQQSYNRGHTTEAKLSQSVLGKTIFSQVSTSRISWKMKGNKSVGHSPQLDFHYQINKIIN